MSKNSPDGSHIAEIAVGNLYALCPQLVEAGIIHIVTPPLYGVKIGKKGKGEDVYVFLRNTEELVLWFCQNIYEKTLTIELKSPKTFDDFHKLNPAEYEDFVRLVLDIGDTIRNVASELVLDPHTVEALSYVTQYLDYGRVNTDRIKEILRDVQFSVDQVAYDPIGHILILTQENNDVIIPLQNVSERLYDSVLPLLNRIYRKKIEVYITTKMNNTHERRLVSITELYKYLKSFDDMFEIERYKGLGEINPNDRYKTCMNPKHRKTYKVTSIGDVTTIFQLLGENSSHRKHSLRR